MTDNNLRWKNQINYLTRKVKRAIGLLSKIRYYVNLNTLVQLYYTLLYISFS